ncbi:8-amino-7-oxononanoate synthase [Azospirillaceae bacterium]
MAAVEMIDAFDLAQWIAKKIAVELGKSVEDIDCDAPFSEIGLDSMATVTLTADIEERLGRAVDPELAGDYPSINELVAFLVANLQTMPPIPGVESENQPNDLRPDDLRKAWFGGLNRRVRKLRDEFGGKLLFEPEIESLEGPWVRVGGRRLLMLTSYSYLGLIEHPRIRDASKDAVDRFGTGNNGSPLLGGKTSLHVQLEKKIARFYDAEDAMIFSSGFMTNLMTIVSLTSEGDWVIGDGLIHASLVDGCQFSKANFVSMRHNDPESLEASLKQAGDARKLVVIDAVYSMDGDIAPLPEIVAACRRNNALLMVDEAHSMGVLGATGRGLCEHFGLNNCVIDIHMGTLSKAVPSEGGFIAGRADLIEALRYNARGYIFSGGVPAPAVAAALAAFDVIVDEPERLLKLNALRERYVSSLRRLGLALIGGETPIVSLLCDSERQTMVLAEALKEEGVLAYPILFPAVPADRPRIRTTVTAAMDFASVDFALAAIDRAARRVGMA